MVHRLNVTDEEIQALLPNLTEQQSAERTKCLAEGLKDEKCGKCKTVFLAHVHFIKCFADDCPMKSTTDKRSVLEMIFGEPNKDQPDDN